MRLLQIKQILLNYYVKVWHTRLSKAITKPNLLQACPIGHESIIAYFVFVVESRQLVDRHHVQDRPLVTGSLLSEHW